MMTTYTIIGSLNYDLVTITNRIPVGGETIQSETFETHIGGKGLNQCISTSKLTTSALNQSTQFPKGVKVRLVGSLGHDLFGKEIREHLSNFDIDLSHVAELEGVRTGVAVILIEKQTGENRILINPGANGHSGDINLDDIFPSTAEGQSQEDEEGDNFVVFQNEIPNVPKIIEWLTHNKPNYNVVYNPSPFYDYSADCLKHIDVLIVNEGESVSLLKSIIPSTSSEYNDWFANFSEDKIQVEWFVKVAAYLNKRTRQVNLNTVIITLGPHGSVYSHQSSKTGVVPAVKVSKILDTTGAGDTFLGGVISRFGSWLQKQGKIDSDAVESALRFSSFASSLAIQRLGASASIPYYDEVVEGIEKAK